MQMVGKTYWKLYTLNIILRFCPQIPDRSTFRCFLSAGTEIHATVLVFEIGFQYIAQLGLELVTFLPQDVPLYPACRKSFHKTIFLNVRQLPCISPEQKGFFQKRELEWTRTFFFPQPLALLMQSITILLNNLPKCLRDYSRQRLGSPLDLNLLETRYLGQPLSSEGAQVEGFQVSGLINVNDAQEQYDVL